jgi:hypothetical protein
MNWQQMIADIRVRGYSQVSIAAACECTQGTISELARVPGREPRYSLGSRLLALHQHAMSMQPMVPPKFVPPGIAQAAQAAPEAPEAPVLPEAVPLAAADEGDDGLVAA